MHNQNVTMDSLDDLNPLVTEKIVSRLSRQMPPKSWRQILIECFNIHDDDIRRIEYSCKELEMVIFRALMDWINSREKQLMRQELCQILGKAKRRDICKRTDWYDFIVPKNLNTSGQEEERHHKKRNLVTHTQVDNALFVHTMLIALIIHLYYVSSGYFTDEACYYKQVKSSLTSVATPLIMIN